MPLFIDLRTDSERPPLRSAEAPAWLGSMPPPLRPEDRRSPPLAPGFFHIVVSLRDDIYCLQLLLGSLGILFEQILMLSPLCKPKHYSVLIGWILTDRTATTIISPAAVTDTIAVSS